MSALSSDLKPFISVILVPNGAEYKAVCRGLKQAKARIPVLPIPMGTISVKTFLTDCLQAAHPLLCDRSTVLVMGLCGSLRSPYQIGDPVVYGQVSALGNGSILTQACDHGFTAQIQSRLAIQSSVSAWTSDQFVATAEMKSKLAQTYQVDVVDMEGAAILETLADTGAAISMVRVISDNCLHNLPDMSGVISSAGTLLPNPLLMKIVREPIGSFRLIRGSLIGLQVLQQVTATLV